MKIAGLADLHLCPTSPPFRADDFWLALQGCVEEIEEYKPDLVLVAGDIFHSRKPPAHWVIRALENIKRLAEISHVAIVPGNHDITGDSSILKVIWLMETLNITYFDKPGSTLLAIGANTFNVQVFGVPWITSKHVAAATDGDAIAETEKLLKTGIQAALGQPFDGYRVFVGHLTMLGATYGGWTPVTVSREVFWQSSWLEGFDAALLGHLHRHQFPDPTKRNICYAGSIERINFGERDEPKGWVSIDLSDPEPKWVHHPIPTRPMIQIECDADDLQDVLAEQDGLEEAMVKLVIHLKQGQPRPYIVFDGCKYLMPPVWVEEETERQRRATEAPTGRTDEEHLAAYIKDRELDGGFAKTLQERGGQIIKEVQAE